MRTRTNKAVIVAALAALSQSADALPPTCATPGFCVAPEGGGQHQQTERRGFVGLNWALGGENGFVPQVVTGFRALQIKNDDSVYGGEVSLSFNVFKGFGIDALKLNYIDGNLSAQGNIGGGYSFASNSFLATAGIQGAHVRAGGDYIYGLNKFKPFLEVNSYAKPQEVNGGGALSCPAAYDLVDASGLGASGPYTKDGKTCQAMPI